MRTLHWLPMVLLFAGCPRGGLEAPDAADATFDLATSDTRVMPQLGFAPAVALPVHLSPLGVLVADLDGDARADVVSANTDNGDVTVLVSTGDGFKPAAHYLTGAAPLSVAAADLDGDGKVDLAVANNSNSVSILGGNGDGTFKAATSITVAGGPVTVIAAQLNSDTKPDLAIATLNGTVVVLRNQGVMFLQDTYMAGKPSSGLAAIDVNNDAHLDLIVGHKGDLDGIVILPGAADGKFGMSAAFMTGKRPGSVAGGTLNPDVIADLVVANELDSTIGVLVGLGNGAYQPIKSVPTVTAPIGVVVLDLDGDGQLDVATVGASGTVNVHRGDGAGNLREPVSFTTGASAGAIAAGDVNGDGKPDLVVAYPSANRVHVLLNATTM